MKTITFKYQKPFELELGGILPQLHTTIFTAGTYNPKKNNVIWVCPTLTASANVFSWWNQLFGENSFYNPQNHFIVCAAVLGSCYGATHPLDAPKGYEFHQFPKITIRDIVRVHDLVRQSLGIERIHTLIGGSSGGKQALEWAIQQPNIFENVITLAASAKQSPWAIAFSATQQMAIEQDPTWRESHAKAGINGLKTARAIAMLSYRSYTTFEIEQGEQNSEKTFDFKASSYQKYQGEKFIKRFDAFTYMLMQKAMDSYNLGRNRGGTISALQSIKARVLSIGLDTDILFPVTEQRYIAQHVPDGWFTEIQSQHGHDGFLVDTQQITKAIQKFHQSPKEYQAINQRHLHDFMGLN